MTCESELAGVPDPSHGPKRGGAVLKQRSIIGSEPISIIPLVSCAMGFEHHGEDEIVVNLVDHAPGAGAGAQGECFGTSGTEISRLSSTSVVWLLGKFMLGVTPGTV